MGSPSEDMTMRKLLRSGGKLFVAVCVLVGAATAVADPNSIARVHAFAGLPDWSGFWLSAAWPLNASGRVPGGEAQLRKTLQLIREPPYNPAWAQKYAAGMSNAHRLR